MPHRIGLAAYDLSCQRGGRTVFDGLSFAVSPGEALLLSGPNGAGKTSLLRQIAGLLPLAAGRFSLDGAAPDAELPELCHYVGHLNAVKTSFSVRENLAFWAEFLGPNDGSLDRALAAFGLGALAELPAGLLSAGQKRKLALSRLFTASRPIWLLDEPQVSLDAASLKLLDKALKDHLATGGLALGGEPHAAQDEICASTRARRQGARRMMRAALALLLRDVKLAFREGGAIGVALGFYLVVVAITPLGLGPDLNLLSRIAPGMLWVALLLAALLSADRIFHNDYEDGALDVLITGPLPLPLVAAIKSLAHWLTTGVPLALIAPLLGLLLNLPLQAIPLLVLSMLAGTPAVSFVAAIGASLTLGLRRSGLLLALLVLPLYVPVLIFGVATASAAITGPASPWPPFMLLCALSLASVVLAPLAAAAALRNALR